MAPAVSQTTDFPVMDEPDSAALIREATQNFSDIVEEKLSKISGTLEKISTTLESQSKRITEAEQRISQAEDMVSSLAERLTDAEKRIQVLADGMDDLESRSRRDNIHVLNLKEDVEGKRPIHFFESWLPTVLGLSEP